MRKGQRDVREMSSRELAREKTVLSAWIRDVTGMNRARLRLIEEELTRREEGGVERGRQDVPGVQGVAGGARR